MKTSLLIADEKLAASKISFVVVEQRILLININNNILSGIFSRDGPPPDCKWQLTPLLVSPVWFRIIQLSFTAGISCC